MREAAALLDPAKWPKVRLCCAACGRLLAGMRHNGWKSSFTWSPNAARHDQVEDPGAAARARRRPPGQRMVHGSEAGLLIGCVCGVSYRVTEQAFLKAHVGARVAGARTLLLRPGDRLEMQARSLATARR